MTQDLWPTCPGCKTLYEEVFETTDGINGTQVTGVCRRCHRRDKYRLVLQLVVERRQGLMGGAFVSCGACGEEYEMLQDQVTHESCPGPQATRPAVCGKVVSKVSGATCRLVPGHVEACSAALPKPEAKKEDDEKGTRFSWLEVD